MGFRLIVGDVREVLDVFCDVRCVAGSIAEGGEGAGDGWGWTCWFQALYVRFCGDVFPRVINDE